MRVFYEEFKRLEVEWNRFSILVLINQDLSLFIYESI
jgi:hypothetical protein